MKKYLQVLSVGIQNTLAYRLNFFFRAGFNLVPLAATIFLWRTIYASKPADSDVAGYELAQMISYYLVVSIVDALTAVNDTATHRGHEEVDAMHGLMTAQQPESHVGPRFSLRAKRIPGSAERHRGGTSHSECH